MDAFLLHRIEQLEAEVRQLRQTLRNLSEAVIAGDSDSVAMARYAKAKVDDSEDSA